MYFYCTNFTTTKIYTYTLSYYEQDLIFIIINKFKKLILKFFFFLTEEEIDPSSTYTHILCYLTVGAEFD